MELDRNRNRDDLENGCRSLGSEFLPSGQSRKISIGIMAEEQMKMRSAARKEDEVAIINTKKGASGQKVVEENNYKSEMVASLKGKHAEEPGQKTSPWISTKSFTQKTPSTRTVQFYAKRTSVLNSGDGVQKKFNRINETPKSEIVQLYAKQSLVLQSSNGMQKKFGGVAYGRSKETGVNTERVEEFAFAAAQEVHMSDKGAEKENKEKRVNPNNDSLKQKLWEALETVPSQIEKNSDSKTSEVETVDVNLVEQFNHYSSRGVNPKQNSDTIETDSESPNISTKRPVTRSLTRNKASTTSHQKLKHTIGNGGNLPTNLSYRRGHQENNIFTFNEAEEQSGSLRRTTSISLTKKSGRKNIKVEPRKISFSGKKNPEKIRQITDRGERHLVANKTPSHSSEVEKSHSSPSENTREYLQPTNGNRKEELHHSSESKKQNLQEDFSSPELPKSSSRREDFWSGFSKKNADPQHSVDSPTLGMKTTIKKYFLTQPSPKSIQIEQGIQSPAPDKKRSATNGVYNLRSRQKSKPGSSGFNAQTDSSDDSGDLKESPIGESSPAIEEIDATHKSSQSSEDREEESLKQDQPINKGCRGTGMGTAGSDNPEKSPLTIRPRKRTRRDDPSSFSPSQKGTVEINELLQLSNQNQEDGLTRAVALFALALEKFKTRMHTQTSKKSSEILDSLAEETQLQLQNVNSQIQRDALKFTSHCKSKRKSLETRFLEQQERLKSLQYKFKEEVAQHLQECQSMLEDFKDFQIELKGDAKKQKTLHQKLLLQVEDTIKTQLSDADRRITTIHKVGREKMFQLRHVITECLKEGVFN